MTSNVNKYGNWWENTISQNILMKKYFHPDESEVAKTDFNKAFYMFVDRVSGIFSNATKDFVKQAIINGDWIPAGRTLYAAGAKGKFKSSLSNCYILPKPEDNIENIFDVAAKMARIFSYGGGCGLDISGLRPKGAKVHNSAKESTGAVSFMDVFNTTAETIGSHGRRAALLIALDCSHPDIEDFLQIKQNNTAIQKANLSIKFTDEFMEAVKNNQKYELCFTVKSTGEEVKRTINAKDFFMRFCKSQYDYAEPGALWIDRIQKYNMLSGYPENEYKIDVTNPCSEFSSNAFNSCLTGDTLVLTNNGVRELKDLVNTQGLILSHNKFEQYQNVISKGIKPVYKLTLENGQSIKATVDHKFYCQDGWKELKDISVTDKVKFNFSMSLEKADDFDDIYTMYGWQHGDGWYSTTIGISFNENDGDYDAKEKLLPLFIKEFHAENVTPYIPCDQRYKTHSYQLQTSNLAGLERAKELGFVPGIHREKQLPTTFWNWTFKQQKSFIRGLLSADGFVFSEKNASDKNQNRQIALACSSEKLVEQVQTFLASVGITARKYVSYFHNSDRNPQYKLSMAGENAIKYYYMFGFCCKRKTDKFNANYGVDKKFPEYKYLSVKSIEPVGEEEVFDVMNVNNTNAFYANGMYVHNCNLSSINLYNFVNNPFTKNAVFDFVMFTKTVQNAVRAMDEILDYGYDMQPLDENRKCIDDWRSIGLGVFGLADMCVALGIKYGSKKANDFIKQIMGSMRWWAIYQSSMLAKEKGSFGKFDYAKVCDSDFIQKTFADDTTCDLRRYIQHNGLRNGTLLAIAPTGSISMLFRQSGGVEPYYQVSYERTTHELEKQNKTFHINMLAVEHLLKANNMNIENTAPEEIKAKFPYVVDTYDINPKDRVRSQAVMQEYVDNAISSTINLKENATVKDIFDLYMFAWEAGCKGITIFRDNCKRISILGKDHGVSTASLEAEEVKEMPKNIRPIKVFGKAEKLNSLEPHKRGNVKSLWGRTFLYHTACVPKFYVTVNIQDGEIFEVFVGADKGCQANISTITRLTSLCLRAGLKVDEIVKNLNSAICPACINLKNKGNTDINKSCASCIASAITEMQKTLNGGKSLTEIKDKIEPVKQEPLELKMIKPKEMMECPECHERTLVPDGKCNYCSNCGYSKCD